MWAVNPIPAAMAMFGLERDSMNTASNFPDNIDNLIYFQDVNLDNQQIMSEYQEHLKNGEYTKATQILKNSSLSYYGADLFNLVENRLFQLQTYYKKNPKINPHVFSSKKPTNIKNGTMWIG